MPCHAKSGSCQACPCQVNSVQVKSWIMFGFWISTLQINCTWVHHYAHLQCTLIKGVSRSVQNDALVIAFVPGHRATLKYLKFGDY